MSAAAVAFALNVSAHAPPPPYGPRVRKRRRLAVRAVVLPALFAVACCVCDRMGPISTTRERGLHPPKKSGFRFTIVHALGGWWCGRCLAKRRRLLPPATRAGCSDGPRPCRRMLCRYHLAFDISRKAPDDFELPESCALDVADKHPEGLTLREVGATLGMTREGAREVELIAKSKLRSISGLRFDFREDDEP